MNFKKAGLIGLLSLFALASVSGAYVLKSWRWPKPSATYNDSALPSSWRNAIAYAANRWENTGSFDWRRSSSSQNKLLLKSIDGRHGTLATTTRKTWQLPLSHDCVLRQRRVVAHRKRHSSLNKA